MGSANGAAKARLRGIDLSAAVMLEGARRWGPEVSALPAASGPKILLEGIDTLELHTKAKVRPEILEAFRTRKEKALERKREGIADPVPWECMLDGDLETTLEMTTRAGKGCTYLLEAENVLTLLVHSHAPENAPSAYVELRARFLWGRSYADAARLASELLSVVCEGEINAQVSRVDLTVDFMGWQPEMDLLTVFHGRAVKRGAHLEWEDERQDGAAVYVQHRRFTGFSFGRGVVVARLYCKTVEIKGTGKLWFRPLWRKEGWRDEETSGPVWRLEFQLRREAVKNAHVRGIDQETGEALVLQEIQSWAGCSSSLGNLWRHLTRDWLSLRLPRTGKERVRLAPAWKFLHETPTFPAIAHAELYRHALDVERAKTLAAFSGYAKRAVAERLIRKGAKPDRARLFDDLEAVITEALASFERRHGDFFDAVAGRYAEEDLAARMMGDGTAQLPLLMTRAERDEAEEEFQRAALRSA